MNLGLISNIQKFSLQDGPGIRTTLFLKGCPLRCAWCHNPENISPRPEVIVFEARCLRCGQCLQVCPQQQCAPNPSPIAAAPDCNLCGACLDACPSGARVLAGKTMTVAEVMAELLKDRVFYEESSGGVSFSGGEPLIQFEFLKAVLEVCRREGIHTAVDTCGFAPTRHLLEIAPLADLFLYDLKFVDEARHQKFTGVSNQLILENLRALSRTHNSIWLRIPIIPTVNDGPEELEAMARFAATIPAIRQVNVLPYHKIGIHKFKRIGQEYSLPDIEPPSAEQMAAVSQVFAAQGLTVKIGG